MLGKIVHQHIPVLITVQAYAVGGHELEGLDGYSTHHYKGRLSTTGGQTTGGISSSN